MYLGIRSEVKTNIGNFGSFIDLEKEMKFNNIPKVIVNEVHMFSVPFKLDRLGEYTYDEIYFIAYGVCPIQ